MNEVVFINRVNLINYKSIAACDVKLGPLTFLIGPNGAGKSNFVDALRLVSESLNTSIDHALRERGGISEVRRRSAGHPTHFTIRINFSMSKNYNGYYVFRVGALEKGGFEVQNEKCLVNGPNLFEKWHYHVECGNVVEAHNNTMPAAISDRLYLVAASGMKEFRPLYDALSHMGFYNLNPEVIRDLQSPDEGSVLRRDGSNLASVLGSLAKDDPKTRDRIVDFLSKVAPGIQDVDRKSVGKKETLEFRQIVGTNESPWRFTAENMSDGTLRSLGIITALFQSGNGGGKHVPFVGIEEPEAAVHPGAAGVLRDALQVASNRTQILVTSHSPDLLDDDGIQEGSILTVENDKGKTIIGPMNDANKSVIHDRLYTVGELMRIGPLHRDDKINENLAENQIDLFGELPE